MKKFLALSLALVMVFALAACGGTTAAPTQAPTATAAPETAEPAAEPVTITMWTFPIGNWKDSATVDGIIAAFNAVNPEITVNVEYLDYSTGDDQVTAAIEAGTTPDIIMEGPERLVSNWGANGKMVDLSDLWTDEAKADIGATSAAVVSACQWTDGAYYEYPLCMTTHCMAINYEVFEAADALQYIDQNTRTWTTENFQKALEAVSAYIKAGGNGTLQETGVVYCGGQGGDQGTRALAMNLYGAKFTDAEHTKYTMNSEAGVKGLQALVDWTKAGILSYDAGIVASDELQLFANGTTAMSFCWNASNAANYASQVTFTPYAVAFPSDDGVPELCGGIWGFGVFNNNDDARATAAKKFISFVCDDPTQGPKSVYETGFFPVRSSFGDIYTGTEKEAFTEFLTFMPYLGDYYNVTPNWAAQRTAWWNMLQQIFGGADVQTAADNYATAALATA